MKYIATYLILIFCILLKVSAQVSPAFKYQSIIRNSSNQVLANQAVSFRFSILKTTSTGASVYTETQSVITNQDGLINLNIGEGLSSDSLIKVAWSTDRFFLKVELDPMGGTNYSLVGTSPILYVPMALYALNGPPGPKGDKGDQGIQGDTGVQGHQGPPGTTSWIDSSLSVATLKKVGIGTLTPYGVLTVQGSGAISDSALFTVKDRNGQAVFTVYETGVAITYNINPLSKGAKGGFTVGGRNGSKGALENILNISTDSIRIYIDSTTSKGAKGGFTVGGRTGAKGSADDYFSISNNSSSQIVNPSKPAILWYPSRNSFLIGQVLIESPDSVGTNSFASGFESKSIGNFSQALGYRSIAHGTNATAIGNYALANGLSSFALGTNAKALNINSYSFGNGAIASGEGSYAFGSQGLVYGQTNQYTSNFTLASGPNSIAFGLGSNSTNAGSIAMGVNSYSSGWGAIAIGSMDSAWSICGTAIGFSCTAKNNHSNVAMGEWCTSSGYASVALGWWANASGFGSVALGASTAANQSASTALGYWTLAAAPNTTAIGSANLGLSNSLFEIGNGYVVNNVPTRKNVFTVLNSGNVGIAISNPSFVLDVKGRGRFISDGSNSAGYWLTNYAGSSNQSFIGMADDNHVGLWGSLGWGLILDVTTGKVGVGTLTPSSNLEVDVNGYDGYSGIAINSKISGGKYLTINQGTAGKLNFTSPGIVDLLTLDFTTNNVGIGSTSPGYKLTVIGTTYCSSGIWSGSDRRWKKNIVPLTNGLDRVLALRGVRFDWRKDEFPEMGFQNGNEIGLIAQEVEAVLPELVKTDNKGYKAVAYDKLGAVLVEAVQEQQGQIEQLKKENIELKSQLDEIKELRVKLNELNNKLNLVSGQK